ncbi:MAG TPA: glutaredoxin family protein [Verrucomicrobiae bacterium]
MKPKSVRLFVKSWCGWCTMAESWLKKHGIHYETINVSSDKAARKEMNDLSGQDLAPVIDVDGQILADFGPDQLAKFWKQFE